MAGLSMNKMVVGKGGVPSLLTQERGNTPSLPYVHVWCRNRPNLAFEQLVREDRVRCREDLSWGQKGLEGWSSLTRLSTSRIRALVKWLSSVVFSLRAAMIRIRLNKPTLGMLFSLLLLFEITVDFLKFVALSLLTLLLWTFCCCKWCVFFFCFLSTCRVGYLKKMHE